MRKSLPPRVILCRVYSDAYSSEKWICKMHMAAGLQKGASVVGFRNC